jgi:BirA family biotin operon repressor/biotin-[acetyl-CoA-carboxylase] ligase
LEKVLLHLRTQSFGRCLTILEECTSTNEVVREMAEKAAPHGLVVIAETQTAGRGRLGRTWSSPKGGIWMSILIRPAGLALLADSLPLIGALAVAKSLRECWNVDAQVRWPNDVIAEGRKLAGVLVESTAKGNEWVFATLGLGINVNFNPSRLGEFSRSSTSLLALLGREVDRGVLIASVLFEAETLYESLLDSKQTELTGLLRRMDCSRGRRVRVKMKEGEIVGVIDDFESLDSVRLLTVEGAQLVKTMSLECVDYESD